MTREAARSEHRFTAKNSERAAPLDGSTVQHDEWLEAYRHANGLPPGDHVPGVPPARNGKRQRDLFHLPVEPPGTSRLFRWRQAIVESDLRPTVRYVALVLSLHMNNAGGSCFPSRATIARECGLDVSNVKRAIYELRDGGWLDVEARTEPSGRQTSNFYTALVPLGAALPPGEGGATAPGEGGATAPPRGRQRRTPVRTPRRGRPSIKDFAVFTRAERVNRR